MTKRNEEWILGIKKGGRRGRRRDKYVLNHQGVRRSKKPNKQKNKQKTDKMKRKKTKVCTEKGVERRR